MNRVDTGSVKYIKLGRRGVWERNCIADGTMRFGYARVPHELALEGDVERLRKRGGRPDLRIAELAWRGEAGGDLAFGRTPHPRKSPAAGGVRAKVDRHDQMPPVLITRSVWPRST